MSNAAEFSRVVDVPMAVPAGRAVVFLDGRPCDFLEVIEIVRSGYPKFGWSRLRYNSSLCHDSQAVQEDWLDKAKASMGRNITVCRFYDGGVGVCHMAQLKLFEGTVEQIERRVDDKGEKVEIVARDASARLDRVTVYGRRVVGVGQSVHLAGAETIFNEDDGPNASKNRADRRGRTYRMFAEDQRESVYWSCAEAVGYLLSEYVVGEMPGGPGGTGLEELDALMGDVVLDELDVEGKSLLDALRAVCEQAGIEFMFVPTEVGDGAGERIVFYRPGQGRAVELDCQPEGETFGLAATNVVNVRGQQDIWPVTHRFVGKGAAKQFEGTFDLVKAWEPSDEGKARTEYSPSTSGDFDSVREVYRRWCLNEAGDYTPLPYERGALFDFTMLFETEEYAVRRRRFLKALTRGDDGESLGYYLEASYDNGVVWQEYADGFDVLSDECGVWLSDDGFADAVWNAAVAGTLRFRMTATVESDERLMVSVADGPTKSVTEVIDHIFDVDSQFMYRKVSGGSIFYNSSDADEVDDSEALHGYVRGVCRRNGSVIETIDVATSVLAVHYQPGDRVVSSADGRDIIGVGRDSRSVFWIDVVMMNFEKQQTNLKVLRSRGVYGNG